jgi:hypothetical protein
MKRFLALHWLIGIFALVVSFSAVVSPALSDDDEDDERETEETSAPVGNVGDTAVLTPFAAAIDTMNQRMNATFNMIEPMLKNSCYDCHSAQTDYPWYHSLPIVGDWMDGHIEEAREHLDFTDGFPLKGKGSQLKLLSEIVEEVEGKHMPLTSYRLLHWGTAIEGPQLDTLKGWVNGYSTLITTLHGFFKVPLPEDLH